MSIPQHLTPLPLKPFKLDKMLCYIDMFKLVSCVRPSPYCVASFRICCCFFVRFFFLFLSLLVDVIEVAY